MLFSPVDDPPITVSPWEEATDRASSVELTEFWRDRCAFGTAGGTARKPWLGTGPRNEKELETLCGLVGRLSLASEDFAACTSGLGCERLRLCKLDVGSVGLDTGELEMGCGPPSASGSEVGPGLTAVVSMVMVGLYDIVRN